MFMVRLPNDKPGTAGVERIVFTHGRSEVNRKLPAIRCWR
ncbi:hypothetical protein RHOER0001_2560 [Rhodococcus erythropolis SK121]|nr:hypothetical protein RHOER0001_2560 [Rhodococcus erythropolis SK121]